MRIFGIEIRRAKDIEQRSLQQTQPSGWGSGWDSIFNGGGTISKKDALSVPAVWSAVDTISKTLASLPFEVYRTTPDGSEPATGHPLYNLIRLEPSPNITSFNFRRDLFVDACFGNAYAKITEKGNGRASMLERLDPDNTFAYYSESGNLYYIADRYFGGKYVREILLPSQIIHLRGITLDGIQGESVTSRFASSLGMSLDATKYGHNFFSNNAGVDKVVTFPGALTPKEREIVENKIRDKKSGIANVGGTMVLDAGASMTKVGLNPQEAMLNDTRNFQAYESCRIFGIPAHMVNILDRSTFNNIEMMDNGFVKYCLSPWCKNTEQEFDVKLLTSAEKNSGEVFHRFNLSGLLRGDIKSRGEYVDKMLRNMVYTINDVRRMDNLNTVPWGDTPYAPSGVFRVSEDGTIEMPDTGSATDNNLNNNQGASQGQQ